MNLQLSCSSEVNAASERLHQRISPEKRKLRAIAPLKASEAIDTNVVDLSSGKYILPDQQELAMDQNYQPPEILKAERETNSSEEDVADILVKLKLSSSEANAASARLDQMISPEKRKLTATIPLKASQAISTNVVDLSLVKYVLPDQQEPPYFVTLLHILGVKDDISAVADAYMRFDKQVLTSIHNKASIYLTHPEIGKILQMHDSPEQKYEGSHEATEAADELVPVSLKDLKAGKLNECAVLYGELCVKPFKFGRIYTLLQEIGTGNAVALSIVSEDASSIDQNFERENYPQGKKIAVKEPMLVRGEVGLLFINVNNPSSIETVESFPPSADGNVAVDEENFKKWMDTILNEAHHSENWDKLMRNCTKGLLMYSKGMGINNFPITEIYAARWHAEIATGRYGEAMLDAEAICELRPSCSDGIKIKIRSLASLGRFQDLHRLLQSARANNAFRDEDIKEFTNIYRTCGSRYFDIGIARLNEQKPSLFRPDGDLIGPVEIQKTRNGNGRGLFATEDIKTGDCLLISKALAISLKAMDDPMKNGLFENVKNVLNSCGDNILKLFLSHASRKLVAKMGDFFNPSAEEKCCKATARVREDFEALPDKDRRIGHIIEGIAFDDASVAALQEKGESFVIFNPHPIRLYYGVWMLPSFINHSCSPNSTRINQGEIIRIHATRSIKEGQEITIPYFNVLLPYPFRQKLCNSFRFGCVCKCKRCEVERKIIGAEPKAEALCESYSSACNAKIEERPARLDKFVNRVENCLTVLRKGKLVGDKDGEDWFRSSFMAAYLGRITCRKKKAVKTSSDKEEEILLRAAHSIIETCPGDIQNLIFCHSCVSFWKGLADEKYARQAYSLKEEAIISVYGNSL
ncbi:hypothetical protein SUGI_0115000 [Cryptomeria japonica]|uniref:uncharacterized protein LOC131054248 n=1 Tax=Cryptomeria japonica TaxID=3369 RepID=UPI002408EFC2|nr:uncharacterized protein LOC131054248 [Cryptomeria japonica]XP_057844696.2 uncharacterized protein LOC131054248 [Cryptomeria japonica]XP_057844698.2 uncharacterized protein LOC131054248 [Cryptomeria japonica]XP_057844700.2 uncharacterized protein LOC131054248 [Cryptomeria japonica]GLJ09737.1 hypothetical protein SUGI_0115000 [Cryptomeria japonica]